MNKNILQKILTELGKEDPSIDYLKGMVETLIETLPGENYATPATLQSPPSVVRTETVADEDTDIPAFLKTGPKGSIG